jgi:molecular chaperone DnaK
VPQIEVTFDIDANGIVNVSAKDHGTGKEQKITITASSGLSKDEVERMMKDAESHAEEDKKRREEIETRNKADAAVYGAEKFLQEMGDKVPASDKTAVQEAVEGLRKAIADNDVAGMSRAMDLLTQMQHKARKRSIRTRGRRALGAQVVPRVQGVQRVQKVPRVLRVRVRRVRKVTSSTPRSWTTNRALVIGDL